MRTTQVAVKGLMMGGMRGTRHYFRYPGHGRLIRPSKVSPWHNSAYMGLLALNPGAKRTWMLPLLKRHPKAPQGTPRSQAQQHEADMTLQPMALQLEGRSESVAWPRDASLVPERLSNSPPGVAQQALHETRTSKSLRSLKHHTHTHTAG